MMLYNICGILITKLGSSMWHTILDNFRPVSVWVTDILLRPKAIEMCGEGMNGGRQGVR